ncbi:MAG: PQQ-binding-like beta-propeller repeat protein [Cyclobacteriaceae bacterium]
MNHYITLIVLVICVIFYHSCSQPSKGEILYNNSCAACHSDNGLSRAPGWIHLSAMTPRSIVAALETGKMQVQGDSLSKEEKITLAQFITGRSYITERRPLDYCNSDEPIGEVKHFGWGGNAESTGWIADSIAQLSKDQVPNLKLKWAFGFEGGTISRSKPTVIGNYLIFGSQFGEVYCLNKETGCVRWMFEADANVRGGIAISQDIDNEKSVYLADYGGNTYALKANSGELIWKTNVKNDPNNAVTGTPAYFDSIVYVPMTSMEVVTAGNDYYECCSSSGQLVAINAVSGKEVWRHRVEKAATEQGVNAVGVKRFGPSGSPVWSSPTIDTKRGLIYMGTGENYSNPTSTSSDAIQALDLKTGELKWNYQATSKDAYIVACTEPNAANCPDPPGPDVDFGMAPLLTTRMDSTEVLIVGQKSGVVHCLNPDTGEPIWKKRIGRGGALGGIHWGMATDGKLVYAPNSDWLEYGSDPAFDPNPGLFALDMMTGDIVWQSVPNPSLCSGKNGCYSSNSAAPTFIPGIVFAGALDGYARAYNANDGEILWEFDTDKSFETINGIPGHGGAIDGPGPVVVDGMVYFNSGYGLFGQMPGNVLLAFAAE